MKTRRLRAKLLLILFLFTVVALPSGCSRPGPQQTLDELFSYLQNAEYPRIYRLLTNDARQAVSLVDLSARYNDIYRSFGLQKAECKLKAVRDAGGGRMFASFTMDVSAERLGNFRLDMEAPLLYEDGSWKIDWSTELVLPGLKQGDRAVMLTNPAKRGEIFDANGDALAKNDYALSVYVDSSLVKDYETLVRLLAPLVGMTEADIRTKLKGLMESAAKAIADGDLEAEPKGVMKVIKAFPKGGLAWARQQALLKIPGVGIDDSWMTRIRYYPYGCMLGQTLGYTGVLSEADLTRPENAGLPRDAIVGKTGLEKAWEQTLRGQAGYELIIEDADGKRKTTIAEKKGSDGSDLRLSIDMRLQRRAELLLREYLSPEMAGCIVVTDPKTGYIQAMASAPSYDPNLFSFPVQPDVWSFLNDPANMKPLINRTTEGRYPPGSTFKPFTASMGLEDSKITAGFVFPYEIKNNYWTPGDDFGVDKPIKRKDATPGRLNLQNAITYSDNIYFAYTALKIGPDQFVKHCLELGLGLDSEHRMRFDLPLEASLITRTGKIDNLRTLADSGYGQGELLVTPVQMAALFGSLDCSGDIMQPRVVRSVGRTAGPLYRLTEYAPSVWRAGVVPQSSLNLLLPALKRVAREGTAKDLNRFGKLKDYEICAKTGTAEIGNDKTREIAWIIGFTTKEFDRLVCVTVEVPAGGGGIRTEIAKRMFEK